VRDVLLCDTFGYPNPKLWPAGKVELFRRLTEPRSLLEIFIFDNGNGAAEMCMEDALTALAVLPVARDQWFTCSGYPSFVFGAGRIKEFSEKLGAAGYRVWLMERPRQEGPPRARGKVIDISTAREGTDGRRRKWA
jgi:hypothetical protein